MSKLTEKQKKFCDFYIISGNATQSAIQAGYSKDSAKEIASENLTKPNVKEYLAERNKPIEEGRTATMEEVKQFWTDMLRDEGADPNHRLKASEYIAKVNAAFTENTNTTINFPQGIDINIVESD